MSIWGKNGLMNGTIEATSIEGCRLIKQTSPEVRFLYEGLCARCQQPACHPHILNITALCNLQTKCFIYHNMELALESMESQRAVMYNASQADFFLQVLCYVAPGMIALV